MSRHFHFRPDIINNTHMNVDQRIVTTLAMASSIANTIGFLANFFLYGVDFPTTFCAICAVFCWITYLIGVKGPNYMVWGVIMLILLCVLEFPLLLLAYGPVMLPYIVLGYMGVFMITRGKKRTILCILLIIYYVAVIIASTLHPYIFGPQDAIGLLGSEIVTFLVTLISLSVCVIIWQSVYVRATSDVDPITGALSQEGFSRNVKRHLRNALPGQYRLLYFNVINFRSCNAVYGIDGGNQVLTQLAERFKLSSRLKPLAVGRFDADHFYVLVDSEKADPDVICDICRFRYYGKNSDQSLQLNCGIYKIKDTGMSITDMCDRAKAATVYSPQIRNVHYAFYDKEIEARFIKDNEVFALVEEAITNKQFVPYFQPIIDCRTGKIASAEALARWIRDDGQVVPPGGFIEVLEQKDLISELDYIISGKVRDFFEKRQSQGKSMVPVSVNLSRVDLYNEKLMNELERMLDESELAECGYRFEVTESVYEAIPANISDTLAKFRCKGALILIDDFGSGYSSLGMITECEFDILKLDMSFARKIDENDKSRGIIMSLIELAHNLGAKVIAEGVETTSQYEFLKENDCDYIQGYYFYKPMCQEEFERLLDK